MAYHNLLSKCDRALVAYLISSGAGTVDDVFHHKRADDIPSVLPYTACFAQTADELIPFSGVYKVKASVTIHTNAAPDLDQNTEQMQLDSDARVAATFDAMHDLYIQSGDQLADLITAAAASAGISDFTVQSISVGPIEQGKGDKDKGEWIDTIDMELICRPS